MKVKTFSGSCHGIFLALILFLSKAHPNLERKDAKCFIAMCLSGDV